MNQRKTKMLTEAPTEPHLSAEKVNLRNPSETKEDSAPPCIIRVGGLPVESKNFLNMNTNRTTEFF